LQVGIAIRSYEISFYGIWSNVNLTWDWRGRTTEDWVTC